MVILGFIDKILALGSPRLWWAALGLVLWALEFVTPTDLVLFVLGACALVIAVLAPVLPFFALQLVLWLGLSGVSLVLVRRYSRQPADALEAIADDTEGKTLTEILPGQPGRVLYEGNSWRALCADKTLSIPPDCPVRVAGRKGNTLLVAPIESRANEPPL